MDKRENLHSDVCKAERQLLQASCAVAEASKKLDAAKDYLHRTAAWRDAEVAQKAFRIERDRLDFQHTRYKEISEEYDSALTGDAETQRLGEDGKLFDLGRRRRPNGEPLIVTLRYLRNAPKKLKAILDDCEVTQQQISHWVKAGRLVKIERGVYGLPPSELCGCGEELPHHMADISDFTHKCSCGCLWGAAADGRSLSQLTKSV